MKGEWSTSELLSRLLGFHIEYGPVRSIRFVLYRLPTTRPAFCILPHGQQVGGRFRVSLKPAYITNPHRLPRTYVIESTRCIIKKELNENLFPDTPANLTDLRQLQAPETNLCGLKRCIRRFRRGHRGQRQQQRSQRSPASLHDSGQSALARNSHNPRLAFAGRGRNMTSDCMAGTRLAITSNSCSS